MVATMSPRQSIELHGSSEREFDQILTPDALEFVAALAREFEPRRQELLAARVERRARLAAAGDTGLPGGDRLVRDGDWTVAPAPEPLQQRWVEITGPTDRKLVINALNSGADGFMADFEDADLADLAQHGRRSHQPARRDRAARSPTRARTGATTSWSTTRRRCWCARAAGICPSATC